MSETRRKRRARPILAVVLALVLFVPLAGASHGEARTRTDAGASRASVGRVPAGVESVGSTPVPATAMATTVPTTSTVVAAAAGARREMTTTTVATVPVPVLVPTSTTTHAPTTSTRPSTTRPSTTLPSSTVPATTSTTVPACRNSTDPACGPYRFDPQTGVDRPMTVQVVSEPATPRAGQEMEFRITLTDPDGVSSVVAM